MEKTILRICMEKGFLLDKEMLNLFSGLDEQSARELVEKLSALKIEERVINKAFFSKNFEKIRNVLVDGVAKTIIEKFFISLGYSRMEIESKEIAIVPEALKKELGIVKVISSIANVPKKLEVLDFVKHFRARYNQIKGIFEEKNFENLISIRRILEKRNGNRENYTVIAAVVDKRITKNKNLIIEIEDVTGKIAVLVNQNKNDLFKRAKELLLDDIVAFQVVGNNELLFANDIIFPDAYLSEKKKSDEEEWVAFTSDVHVGSTMFLRENFLKFIRWLNGEEGDYKQVELAKKVKYLFLTGDCIDGVGVYPDQDKLLEIKDIKEQYSELARLLKTIRKDIKLILSPGQHDGVRVAEPQPIVEERWAPDLHKIENLTLVPNPCLLEIDGGFKVLMYHGASFHSIIEEMDELRLNYGHNSPTKVVKELLKRRHLSPTHGSVVYIPNDKEDPLAIKYIPDIVATGDLHRPDVGIYNNILMIASSCWQSITPFEEKVGNHPEPCKVPLLNLKTREVKVMDFSNYENEKSAEIK